MHSDSKRKRELFHLCFKGNVFPKRCLLPRGVGGMILNAGHVEEHCAQRGTVWIVDSFRAGTQFIDGRFCALMHSVSADSVGCLNE